jgi:outer membrane protein assembly factor BamB
MPDDLAKKIESTRGADTRAKLKDSEVDAYVADFIKPLDPNLSGKFRTHIETRLKAGRAATEWKHLVAMAKVRDKEFPSFGELYFTVGEYGYPADLAKQMIEKTISAKDTVVCLDALTGKQIWKKEFPGAHRMIYMGNCGYGASGTPAVAGDKIYVQGSAGLYCLSVKDGAVIWQKETTFTNSSPLVANGAVYVTYPDLIAYDAETGRLLWKTPVGAGGYSGPNYSVVSWTSGGKNYLVGISDGWGGGLYCIDPDTGKPLWKVASVGGGEGSSSVAIKDDTAVFYGSGGIYAFKLTPQKAEQLWKTPIAAWRGDSMIIYQDYVYAGSSNPMRCLDLKTGAVKWETKKLGNFYSSPILADGKVLYPTGHGWYPLALAMFRATPDQYEELGRFPSNYSEYTNSGLIATCSSPAIADGRLYLRCGGNVARRGILGGCVACYDLRAESK